MLKNILSNQDYYVKTLSKVIISLIVFLPLSSMFSHFFILGEIANNTFSVISVFHIIIYLLLGLRFLFPPKISTIPFVFLSINILYFSINLLINPTSPEFLISNYFKIILLLFSVLAMVKVTNDINIEQFSKLFSISIAVLIACHVSSIIVSPNTVIKELGNFVGYLPTKHASAAVFWGAFPFAFFLYFNNKSKLNLILLFLIVFFLLFSYQRTAMLSFVLFLFFYALIRKSFSNILRIIIISLIVIVVLYFISLSQFWNIWIQPEINAFNDGNIYSIGKGRIGFYVEGFRIFISDFTLSEKLFGIGYGMNYIVHYLVTGFKSHAHIQFIATLIDNGIVALILLFLFYLSLIFPFKMDNEKNNKEEIVLGLTILFVAGISIFYSMNLTFGSLSLCFLLWIGFFLNGKTNNSIIKFKQNLND